MNESESKLRGEWLWEMFRAHVVPSVLGEVQPMMRGIARTHIDKTYAALSPRVRDALDRCATNISSAVVTEWEMIRGVLKDPRKGNKLDPPRGGPTAALESQTWRPSDERGKTL